MVRRTKNSCLSNVIVGVCIFLIVAAVPITQIALGARYLHECPISPGVPVYVLGCGLGAVLLIALFALPKLFCPSATDHKIWRIILVSLILFFIVWIIFGSYVVYSIYPPNYTKIILKRNRTNNDIFTTAAPPNMPDVSMENQSLNHSLNQNMSINQNMSLNQNMSINQNMSLNQNTSMNQIVNMSQPSLNVTWMINDTIQTVMNLTPTMSESSSEKNREHPNASQTRQEEYVKPYCNKNLYLFAFSSTTFFYTVILMLLCPKNSAPIF